MFGIGGGEIMLILFIVLMLFGSDKVPEIARTLGKFMAQLKNATNDIKSEIQKGAENNGLDKSLKDITSNFTDVTSNINSEINKAKVNILADTTSNIESVKENLDDLTGPIKRQ
jgi:sec-independent protein translocase protein TatA